MDSQGWFGLLGHGMVVLLAVLTVVQVVCGVVVVVCGFDTKIFSRSVKILRMSMGLPAPASNRRLAI